MQLDEMHVALVSLAVHLLSGEHFVVRLKKTLRIKMALSTLFQVVKIAMGKDGTSLRSGNFTPNFVKS